MDRIITTNLDNHFDNIRHGIPDPLVRSGYINNERKQQIRTYASGITVANPEVYNPLFSPSSLQMPRDRKQSYYWCRHFYETEPYVAGCVDFYSQLSVNKFYIESENKEVESFFDDMFEEVNLFKLLKDIAFEYWKLGDVFPMAELNTETKRWNRITLLNPDFVEVRKHSLADEPMIEFIPDDELKRIVFERDPREMYDDLMDSAPELVECIRRGINIPINPDCIAHIRHAGTRYAIYGTPFLKRVFKSLMYREMLRRAQFTIAQRYVSPLKIFKLGTQDELPEQAAIDDMQEKLTTLMNNPNTVLVTHARLEADWQGASGKVLQLNSEYETMENEMLAGMGVNKAFLAGEGPTYANASIGGEAFVKRLESFREELRWYVKNKIILPLIQLNGFYDPKTHKPLKVDFRWDKLELRDEFQKQNILVNLRKDGVISVETLLEAFRIDSKVEQQRIKEEMNTVFDPVEIAKRIGGQGDSFGKTPNFPTAQKPAKESNKESDEAAKDIMDQRIIYRNLKNIRKEIHGIISKL